MDYERPFVGLLGDQWKITLHGDAAAYDASEFNEQPNFGPSQRLRHGPGAAAGRGGFPLAVRARRRRLGHPADRADRPGRSSRRRPATARSTATRTKTAWISSSPTPTCSASTASPASTGWTAACGPMSPCTAPGIWAARPSTGWSANPTAPTRTTCSPMASGLHDEVSDIVARGTFAPTQWLDLTYRTRLDKATLADPLRRGRRDGRRGQVPGVRRLHLHDFQSVHLLRPAAPPPAGNTYYFPRNEVTLGVSSKWGDYRFSRQRPARPGDEPDGRGRCRRDL